MAGSSRRGNRSARHGPGSPRDGMRRLTHVSVLLGQAEGRAAGLAQRARASASPARRTRRGYSEESFESSSGASSAGASVASSRAGSPASGWTGGEGHQSDATLSRGSSPASSVASDSTLRGSPTPRRWGSAGSRRIERASSAGEASEVSSVASEARWQDAGALRAAGEESEASSVSSVASEARWQDAGALRAAGEESEASSVSSVASEARWQDAGALRAAGEESPPEAVAEYSDDFESTTSVSTHTRETAGASDDSESARSPTEPAAPQREAFGVSTAASALVSRLSSARAALRPGAADLDVEALAIQRAIRLEDERLREERRLLQVGCGSLPVLAGRSGLHETHPGWWVCA